MTSSLLVDAVNAEKARSGKYQSREKVKKRIITPYNNASLLIANPHRVSSQHRGDETSSKRGCSRAGWPLMMVFEFFKSRISPKGLFSTESSRIIHMVLLFSEAVSSSNIYLNGRGNRPLDSVRHLTGLRESYGMKYLIKIYNIMSYII